MSKQDLSEKNVIYSTTKHFITVPKKTNVKLYMDKIVIDNKAYGFKELSITKIISMLWLYILLIISITFLFIYFVQKVSAKIDMIDMVIICFAYISGISFYFGYSLNNKIGHTAYMIFLFLLFLSLILTVILKTYTFLLFISLFHGILSGGILFWLFYEKTYQLKQKDNEVIFKFMEGK